MHHYVRTILILTTGLVAVHAFADQSEEHDPVRNAQRLKDCVAENVAKQDGRSQGAIKRACEKAIAEGTYHDPNISLDGMIKPPSQQ
jgi:hypothetical protein